MIGVRRLAPPDFVYGNTRIRARRGRPPQTPAADPAGGPGTDPTAATAALATRLRELPGLYQGDAAEIVGALLARYDLADVVTLLRGALGGQPAAVVLPAVLAVHRVTDAAARDVAAAGDPAVAVQRLVRHRLPDPQTARALPAIWQRYELHRDSAELERELALTAWRHTEAALARFGAAADPVLAALRREHADLLDVERLRLEGGDPAATAQVEADRVERREAVAARGWTAADPLGAAVPVAAVHDAQAAARQLRRTALDGPRGGAGDG